MSDAKWIRLYLGLFTGRKFQRMEAMENRDLLCVVWIKMLILAGQLGQGGALYFTSAQPYTDEMLAQEFGRPLESVQLALRLFERFEMINRDENGAYRIKNWGEYQTGETRTERTENGADPEEAENDRSICATVAEAWNRTGYVKAKKFHFKSQRGRNILARVREFGLETVLDTIRRTGESEFLPTLGDRITLDWFLNQANFQKCYEGAYDVLYEPKGNGNGYRHGADRLRDMIERGEFDE